MDFESRYKKLNDRQREAVDTIDGPLMVIAGPGTGKTELLSMRAANILRTTDTLPGNILCLTFTESGAAAMRERLSEIIGASAYKVAIHTFHSFGSEVINQNGEYFYHGANFRPASDLNSYELLRSIFDSLDFSSPLAGMMNGEYTHLSDTLTTISELKKSGLTNDELLKLLDSNEAVLDAVEADIAEVFSGRIGKKTAAQLEPLAKVIAGLPSTQLPPGISPLASVLALSLAHAIDTAHELDSTKPITAWKNAHLEKNERGEIVFKDRRRAVKLRAVSYLYYQYLMKMQESELYDFDDMVLRVVHALEVFADLRYNLQERYQYIMVDEFQDTNLAQARILHNLTSLPTGDSANIMVVGDDDQAIYSFQGAEVGNILSFRDQYENVKIITLTDNYRSAEPILTQARSIIVQGEERLERYVEGIDKTLTPHRKDPSSTVDTYRFARIEDERRGLVGRIKAQIQDGATPSQITVLARRHHELVALLPYFASENIAVNYERRDNVLKSEVVTQLVLLARIICDIADGEIGLADSHLPTLLAHEAWGYTTESLWNLSVGAHKHHGGWLEQMAVMPEFTPLHSWLLDSARLSTTLPVERMIDRLVGTPDDASTHAGFISPLYPFFFSAQRRDDDPDCYVAYLEALRTIRARLSEYLPNASLTLRDFIEFIDLHDRLDNAIMNIRVRSVASDDAVNLMTAHKSKGLEFDHVHIVGAIDTSWGERVRTRSRLIGYPVNLPISPSGDSLDERLRLFFVALTRARSTAHISYSLADINAKPTLPASFLVAATPDPITVASSESVDVIESELRQEWYGPYLSLPKTDMQTILSYQLDHYKLSATHLTTFLDVTRGGPQYFLINNLLHFPVSKAPSAQYGSAIHDALQRAHSHLAATKTRKPEEDVLQDFERSLASYHMPEREHQTYLQRGTKALTDFLQAKYLSFNETQRVEVSFREQQSRVGEATITGALDLIDIDHATKTMVVTDYKTGAPSSRWTGKTESEKIKLYHYRQQLLFYKLLVERSRDYAGFTVEKGCLQFVEPDRLGDIHALELEFEADELDRLSRLIERVYRHITSLTLPEVSAYPETLAGIKAFEDDIIAGIV